MPDSFTVGESPAHVHVPASVTFDPSRNGYIIRCGSCLLPIALIPMEWPIAQTLTMWQDDAQRWDFIREADAVQRRGEQCVCGRAPVGVQQVNGSRCGQCDPRTMMIIPPPEVYGTAPGAAGRQSAYDNMLQAIQQVPKPKHGIEDVRHKGGATAFRCVCGWGISQQFAKTVFEAHGERELIKMLETHMAGGQVGPITRPKMEWRAPNFVELLQHRPFWKSPICRQHWQTPLMSEPAFTPRRRIILEE